MCLATLGQIKKIKNDNTAEVDFDGVQYDINIELINAKIGDYVMVHAGFAIEKVKMEEYKEITKLTAQG